MKSKKQNKPIDKLEQKLDEILFFLNKTYITSNSKRLLLAKLPLYILIGPKNSGKTSLLANSGINFKLAKKELIQNIDNTSSVSEPLWWATDKILIIDMPGNLSLLKNFLNLLEKRGIQPTNILLTLNLPELIIDKTDLQLKNTIEYLKKAIIHTVKTFKQNLYFNLIITKCDTIPGFSEFFRDCSREDLIRPWGTTIPNTTNNTLADNAKKYFNKLIKRLNQQLILRLHQERNYQLRTRIKDFPLKIDNLGNEISNLLQNIPYKFNLQGIWLTSAKQDQKTNKTIANQANSTNLTLPHLTTTSQEVKSKAFFTQGLLQHTLPFLTTTNNINKKNLTKPIIYFASVLLTILAISIFIQDFYLAMSRLDNIRTSLYALEKKQHKTNKINTIPYTLHILTILKTAQKNQNQSLKIMKKTPYFYSNKTEAEIKKLYHYALKKIFLPALSRPLEEWLQKIDNTTSKQKIYQALKTQQMLAKKIHFNKNDIIETLFFVTNKNFSNTSLEKINIFLDELEQEKVRLASDNSILNKARSYLTNMPKYKLAGIILNNDIIRPRRINSLKQVPMIFTKKYYKERSLEDISNSAYQSIFGNAILGKFNYNVATPNIKILIEQLRNKYDYQYAKFWLNQLTNLKLQPTTNITTTQNLITELASQSSNLLYRLKIIHNNTNFAPISKIYPQIHAINILFNTPGKQNLLAQSTKLLDQLHYNLEIITTSFSPSNKAKEIIKNSIENKNQNIFLKLNRLANQTPPPIKNWLSNLANNSWQQVINIARLAENNIPTKNTTANIRS